MNGASSPLSLLTAMLTPAVLISACGTLILSTSMRLARIVDRVRELGEKSEEIADGRVRATRVFYGQDLIASELLPDFAVTPRMLVDGF